MPPLDIRLERRLDRAIRERQLVEALHISRLIEAIRRLRIEDGRAPGFPAWETER